MSLLCRVLACAGITVSLALPSPNQNQANQYFNYETALTNPIRLSLDGSKLFCVNNPNGSVSVFDITAPSSPKLTAEIVVGIGPVSVNVNPQNADEIWVVNQASDSVSVVSISKKLVVDTLAAKDEPADVVFAGNHAFVSIARSNLINVYDLSTHALVKSIPVFGGGPRAMTVDRAGSTVYAAFAMSGNQTTTIPASDAIQPAQPPNLPPIPQQYGIALWNDPTYSQFLAYTMPDNDVVAIDTSTLAARKYYTAVGTVNLGLAIQPATGNLFVSNTDANNLTRLITNLCGRVVTNRISRVTPDNTVTAFDLNAGLSQACGVDTGALSTALAQPAGIVFDGTGKHMYVAAFGTDRVAKVDTNGRVLARIELNPDATGATVSPASKRGPRGLAINNTTGRLYVFNRISDTFSIIDTASNTVTAYDIPAGSRNPETDVIKKGRGFLYDAKLSGNGTVSCASCHVDGETDHLIWDLGNPNGQMVTVTLADGSTAQLNPMKGPMTTLTLRGLVDTGPYHWRGDKPTLNDFNEAFQSLMGGNQLSSSDMQAFVNFLNTIRYMPNPNQNLDRSYPTSLAGGNAANGRSLFATLPNSVANETCEQCHTVVNGTIGSNLLIDLRSPQPVKTTQLRAVYQKLLFNSTGPTIDGIGLTHGGIAAGLADFLDSPAFPGLAGRGSDRLDIAAFLLAFDTGTAPAVGYTRTLLPSNVGSSPLISDWQTLESQAASGNCGLIAWGTIQGTLANLVYSPSTKSYLVQNGNGLSYTHSQLAGFVAAGDTLTIMGTPI